MPRRRAREIDRARELGKPMVVDPRAVDPAMYRGATLVRPNLHEASVLLGREIASPRDIDLAGRNLRELFGGATVLLTRCAAVIVGRLGTSAVQWSELMERGLREPEPDQYTDSTGEF